jgi:hypothetical protein
LEKIIARIIVYGTLIGLSSVLIGSLIAGGLAALIIFGTIAGMFVLGFGFFFLFIWAVETLL